MSKLQVVFTCSKRKRSGGKPLRVSTVRDDTLSRRMERWIAMLSESQAPARPARELYVGEQWSVIRALERQVSDSRQAEFWLLSAGYGLIPLGAPIQAYAATFSREARESVFDAARDGSWKDAVRAWWRGLSQWNGPCSGPRSLAELIEHAPDSAMLIAASPVYLAAVEEDLEFASDKMLNANKLLIFSAGARAGSQHLSFDARLRLRLGGSLMSLNTRALAAVLRSKVTLERTQVQELLDDWTSETPPISRAVRASVSDAVIESFILDQVRKNGQQGWTPLLRSFRETGRACEQNRFRRLYNKIGKPKAAGK